MEIDIKIILRFLKEEKIYYAVIETLRIFMEDKSIDSVLDLLKDNFIINGSCNLFFEWMYKLEIRYNGGNKNRFSQYSLYDQHFKDYLNSLKK